jgi:hypothetical protein
VEFDGEPSKKSLERTRIVDHRKFNKLILQAQHICYGIKCFVMF